MNTVHVRYFAAAREAVGSDAETLDVEEGATVAGALAALVERHPPLGAMADHLRIAVDERFASPATVLTDGAVVALLPPVSGG